MSDATNPDIIRYLEAVGFEPDDLVSVNWKRPSGGLGFRIVKVSAAHDVINARQAVDCWIGANPMRRPKDPGSRGTAEDVTGVRALWADLDVGPGKLASYAACREVIAEVSELIGAQPVVIVASGHGLQPRWRIDFGEISHTKSAAFFIERFGQLVQLVAERHGGSVDNVYDLARILRAPGTTNLKIDGKPVSVRVKFADEPESISLQGLEGALDEYVPLAPPAPAIATEPEPEVSPERGNRYVKSVLAAMRDELADIADWPVGKSDSRGRGWEKIQADAAYRLAELAKADWNELTLERAKELFADMAPVDDGWTMRDVVKKWNSQVGRAEPAPPPATVTDPLAPGYEASMEHRGDASPHAAAPDVWSGAGVGDDAAGAARGDDVRGTDVDPHEPGTGEGVPADPASAEEGPEWRKYTWDDFGNAERVVALFGDRLRYSESLDRWFRYADGAWRETKTGGEKAVQEMIRQLRQLESGLYSDEEYPKGRGQVTSDRLEFLKWWDQQKSASKVRAAATVIKVDGELDVSVHEFDAEPLLLNSVNGVIDLRSGELLEHDPKLLLRRQITTPYDPDAKAPMWEQFLGEVQPDEDVLAYLQRIVGYSMTAATGEQAIFIHQGPPASGKSVFLRVMEAVLGEYSSVVPPTTLLAKKMEQHPTDIASMEGRRMLQVDETPEGARLDEALIKRLSGQGTVSARGMGQDFRNMKIIGKVHLATNHLPHITGDPAMKRRLHVIPWSVEIPFGRRDKLLADRIIAQELPGVLAWMVRGALQWGQRGLKMPMDAALALEAWVAEEDEFGQYIAEELVPVDNAAYSMSSKQLYIRYAQWCESMRMKPMSHVQFGRKLADKGIKSTRTSTERRWMVRIRAEDPLAS